MTEHTSLVVYHGDEYNGGLDVLAFTIAQTPACATFKTEFINKVNSMLDQRRKFFIIIDTSQVKSVSYPVSKQVMSWMSRERPRLKNYLQGSSIIVTNDIVRGVMNVVFAVQRPVAPMMTVSTMDEAWEFIRSGF